MEDVASISHDAYPKEVLQSPIHVRVLDRIITRMFQLKQTLHLGYVITSSNQLIGSDREVPLLGIGARNELDLDFDQTNDQCISCTRCCTIW